MTRRLIEILGFGDSLTAGTPGYEPGYGGDSRSQYGYWLLQSADHAGYHNLRFTNGGVPGELASTMNARLRTQLRDEHYDITILMAGTNDLGWGTPVDEVASTLRGLWRIVVEHGVQLVACTIPPIGYPLPGHQETQRRLNSAILSSGCRGRGIVTVDVFSALADGRGLLPPEYDSGDGLHLSVDGYRVIGETVWNRGVSVLLTGQSDG